MAYISIDELKNRLEEQDIANLSNDATGATNVNAILNEIIYDSQSIVDSYVQKNYDTPLSEPAPRSIRNVTGSIAIYFLHMRREWTVSDEIRRQYEDAIDWLEKLSNGEVLLSIDNNSNASGYFGGETRIFQGISNGNTVDKFNGF